MVISEVPEITFVSIASAMPESMVASAVEIAVPVPLSRIVIVRVIAWAITKVPWLTPVRAFIVREAVYIIQVVFNSIRQSVV